MDSSGWDAGYADAELVWSAEPNQVLVAETDDLPAGRALDVGCGEGRNAIWLASKGWDVVGVDFSDVGLDKARRAGASALGPSGVLLVIGHDITNLTDGHGGPQDPAVLVGPDDVGVGLSGLAIDKAERLRRPVATERGTVDAIDVPVRAHRV